jgi:dTDP-4-amino-4,6-dideoxygalactose transaminase
MRNAFGVVDEFERRVAEYAGSKYAVAVDCCTSALFLCFKFLKV